MGFEVKYNYYDRDQQGKYDTTKVLTVTKKVGSPYEEIPYEKLAAIIMGQMARRDIMVIDAEIYEFAKKKISFKESSGGVVIKGKKYSFEIPNELPMVEQEQEQEQEEQQEIVTKQAYKQVSKNIAPLKKRPLRMEFFEPHKDLLQGAKNLKFTLGKQYPIYEERPDPRGLMFGMQYVTVDDEQNKQILSDKLFVFRASLEGGFQESSNLKLDYGSGLIEQDMPALR